MIAECQLQCLARKKHISRPTLRLPVEAEDVEGKKGEKGKNKFCYTKDLSATRPLPTSFPGFSPTRSTERERAGRRKPWERGWTFGPLLGNLAVVPFAVGSTAIVDQ